MVPPVDEPSSPSHLFFGVGLLRAAIVLGALALGIYAEYRKWRDKRTSASVARFREASSRRDYDAAESALRDIRGVVPARLRFLGFLGTNPWLVLNCRLRIAFGRGDLKEVLRFRDVLRGAGRSRAAEPAYSLGHSAIALALLGDADGARAEIAALRRLEDQEAETLARAALAEALCADKGQFTTQSASGCGLRETLAENAEIFQGLEGAEERALFRALQRASLASGGQRYGYRHIALDGEASTPAPTLEEWIAKVAPSLARFHARAEGVHGSLSTATPKAPEKASLSAMDKVLAARRPVPLMTWREAKRIALALVAFALVIVAFVYFARPLPHPEPPTPTSPLTRAGCVGAALALLFGIFFAVSRWNRRRMTALRLGHELLAQGRFEEAEAQARKLTYASDWRVSALAGKLLVAEALAAQRRFAEALEAADMGLAILARLELHGRNWPSRVRRKDGAVVRFERCELLHTKLIALRAPLLALLGRSDEALAEVELLGSAPALEETAFLVGLFTTVREGDFRRADALAKAHPAYLLNPRTQALAALLSARASSNESSKDEQLLLQEALSNPTTRRWVSAVAPTLL
jgi:hypothetical protein